MAVSMLAKLTAEFTGTFLLVATIGCNVLGKTAAWAPVSIASVLMVAIYAFGPISGGNFNPAVSLALGISKSLGGSGMDWKEVCMYWVVQVIGGISAGFFYFVMFGQAFILGPSHGFPVGAAGACELLYTFMLCFVVLNTAVAEKVKPNSYYGLAIGFVIIAGGYGAGAISGGCFNPAVAIGIDMSSLHQGFGECVLYVCFELMGAALAVGFFKAVRPVEFGGSAEVLVNSQLISEFLGTFMLVLTVGLNVLGKSPAAPFSIAASLMCMVYALGDVSGAHFNPAVTLAVFCTSDNRDNLSVLHAGMYMLTQIIAGIVAQFTYYAIYSGESFPLGPGKGYGWSQVALAEILFTFVLCLVVISVAGKGKSHDGTMFGLAIGSCVTVGGYAIGKISGGSLNPAVSIGIASSEIIKLGPIYNGFIYAGLEFVGALAAVGIFKVTHAEDIEAVKDVEN